MTSPEDKSVEELRAEIELDKEQIAEWSVLVKEFGDKLQALEREENVLVAENERLEEDVAAKKKELEEEKSKLAQVEEEIRVKSQKVKSTVAEKMEMQQQAATCKRTLQNMIDTEIALEKDFRAKQEVLSNEFQPTLSKLAAQEKLLNEESILMRQEVDQAKDTLNTLKSKEEVTVENIRKHKELLSESQVKFRELQDLRKAKQEDFDKRRTELSNEIKKKDKILQDLELQVRDKVFALAEITKELEKVDGDHNSCQLNLDSANKETHSEREQIRSLEMNLLEVEGKQQVEQAKLTALKKELEEANAEFKRKSQELSEITEAEQQEAMAYVDGLEKELGLLKTGSDDEMRNLCRPGKDCDPELESLRKEIDEMRQEIARVKKENAKQAEEVLQQHLKRKAQLEVENARMSNQQRLCHLNEVFKKERDEVNRQRSENDLKLSEHEQALAALKAEVSTRLAHVAPEVWKQREETDDDDLFEERLNKQVKQFEMNLHMNETKYELVVNQTSKLEQEIQMVRQHCQNMKETLKSVHSEKE